ncbi:hypothetical protein PPROV_000056800 [Pycnococcus provasolii]|uniref:PsbP C-terminal domain-containing protein n=1 Tax=Pycnococcus provasolii TaxID=41880 RepID=A0A830H815_9CHLO|nr:hypothetical protein PPROV_000056800 [Pycnococcus provasolii]
MLANSRISTRVTAKPVASVRRSSRAVVCSAQAQSSASGVESRRSAIALFGGVAGAIFADAPAFAAYGEKANVFGSKTENTDFYSYSGDGFQMSVPGKWNPDKEIEYPGQQMRYVDNYDTVSSLYVSKIPSSKSNVKDFGDPIKFLEAFSDVLGKQSYQGSTASEGGFEKNRVSVATVVSADAVDRNGVTYYKINILTRTADGNEGGRHQLIAAGVGKDKNLYIMKVQMGEKRWVKGGAKDPYGAWDSFTITA